jgi:hypothetical protein
MTITADSLLPRPKLDYDVGYDAAVKGASVVVWTCRTGSMTTMTKTNKNQQMKMYSHLISVKYLCIIGHSPIPSMQQQQNEQ